MSGEGSSPRFEILGRPAAWRDGRELDLGPGKQRAVLAVLLLKPRRPVPTASIVAAVWGDDPPDNGANVVQKYVAGLRRVLEPDRSPRTPGRLLALTAGGYALHVPPEGLDTEVFQARVKAAQAIEDAAQTEEMLREALAMWRGPALAGLNGAFFDAARNRLEEMRAAALEACAEAGLESGQHARLVPELLRLVTEFPLREGFRYLLMLALYRCGRQAEALTAYRDARDFFADEFGVEPGERLRDLHVGILRSDPALKWPPQDEPTNHAVAQPANHSVTQPANHAVTQPANHAVAHPVNHAVDHPSNHAAGDSTDSPAPPEPASAPAPPQAPASVPGPASAPGPDVAPAPPRLVPPVVPPDPSLGPAWPGVTATPPTAPAWGTATPDFPAWGAVAPDPPFAPAWSAAPPAPVWGAIAADPPTAGLLHDVPPVMDPAAPLHVSTWAPPPGRRVPWPLRAVLLCIPVLSFGLATWAVMTYYAVRRRSRLLTLAAVGYLALSLLFLVGATAGDPDQSSPWDGPIFIALLVTMFGAAVHLALLTADPQPPAAHQGGAPVPDVRLIERRVRREQARSLAAHHPAIAHRLGIGRPDLPSTFDDGGLVDVNSAPEHVLAMLPGLDASQAKLIVLARSAHGPLASVDDLATRRILPYQALHTLRETMIALPPLPETEPAT
nr:BTAD domain-containing putative transcriptional regulator [Actinomadura bangladeshensis]